MALPIFDEGTVDLLKSLGFSEEEIRRIKYEKTKEAVLNKLSAVIKAVEDENLELLQAMLSTSPAGDCMGCDNYFIDFSDIIPKTGPCGEDLVDTLEYIIELRDSIKGKK